MATPQAPSVSAEIVKSTQTNIESLRDRVSAIIVKDAQSYIAACNLVTEGRGFIKKWEEVYGPTIRSAKEHYDLVRNELKERVVAAEAVVAIVEKKAEDYRVEEKRQAEVEQRRINEENRRAQQKKADDDRIEAERLAKEERDFKVAEIRDLLKKGVIGKREAEKRLKAAGAEQEAAKCAAAAAAEEAAAAPAPEVKVEPNIPKVAGIKGRTNWKFKIVDAQKLPRPYLIPDEVSIGNLVRSMKDKKRTELLIPGIEVYTEESV